MSDDKILDPQEMILLREAGLNYVRQNLKELCEEVSEWHNSAVLRDGKVRILAREYFYFATPHELHVAEEAVKIAAMEFVMNNPQGFSKTAG